ncbi:MAG: hypothetical protein R3B09_11420 [Nannocystaceae bacterium]
MARRDRQAELQRLAGPGPVALLEGRPHRRFLGGDQLGHLLEGDRGDPAALVPLAGERLPGEEERLEPLVVGELGGPREGLGGPGIAEEERDPAALVVGPREVGRAAEELPELAGGRPGLAVAPERLREAEAGERRVGIEVEVATEEATRRRRQELALLVEDVLAELAVVAVEHRDLAEEREDQPLDRRRVGRAGAVLLDEDDVGALGPRIGGEHQEVRAALPDHPIAVEDPPLGAGGRGRLRLVADRQDQRLGIGEVDPVPALPEHRRRLAEARAPERPRIGRRARAVEPFGRVTQAILDPIEGRLDLSTPAGGEGLGGLALVSIAHAARMMPGFAGPRTGRSTGLRDPGRGPPRRTRVRVDPPSDADPTTFEDPSATSAPRGAASGPAPAPTRPRPAG